MKNNIKKSLLGKRDLSTGKVAVSSALGRILLHSKADSVNIISAIRAAVKDGKSSNIKLHQPIKKEELKTSK
ncbi:hypothetical protein [uncultured Chryseobacterium sp.]|uniref:hypothetical protein n=1 Tax=uncultured Chryseobacterium sp. TaxID=259322 RepID=UPI0025CE4794|nr:hypothetical protein [uncultured Chryseobacterium sp.]